MLGLAHNCLGAWTRPSTGGVHKSSSNQKTTVPNSARELNSMWLWPAKTSAKHPGRQGMHLQNQNTPLLRLQHLIWVFITRSRKKLPH